MRTVLSLFLSALLWATTCAYAQTDEVPYQIDEQATAQTKWKVGDIVATDKIYLDKGKDPAKVYRKFIGITNKGYFVVQDFYQKTNQKYSDVIAIAQKNLVVRIAISYLTPSFDGALTIWHENGNRQEVCLYQDGKKQGACNRWYENGQKYSEVEYRDGKKQGIEVLWYESGQKYSESQYQDGKLQGAWICWHENGRKKIEGQYLDGKEQGQWASWYENGQKSLEGQFVDGKMQGFWIEWDRKGRKIEETVYHAGKMRSEKTFD